jgi:hypothetical protein
LKPVITRPAHIDQPAHVLDRKLGLGVHFFFDLLIQGAP